jgi:predicted CoA-binding protein
MNETALIHELLTGERTIAVVGYSTDPTRPSNSVSRYLRGHGFRIIPVNPRLRGAVIDGEQSYEHLVDIPAGTRVDLVDVFRRGEFLDEVVEDAIAAKIPAIWFQLDLGNIGAARRAEAAGLGVIWDRCTAIEHRRLRAG